MDKLVEGISKLIELRLSIYELKAKEQIVSIISKIAALTILLSFGLFMVLFLSIGLGFYLNGVFDSSFAGFLIVGGFYFLIGFLMLLNRAHLITNPLFQAFFSKTLIETDEDDEITD